MAKAEVQACNGTADGGQSASGVGRRRGNDLVSATDTYRYLTFKWSFRGMHMLHMAAQMVRSGQKETRLRLRLGRQLFGFKAKHVEAYGRALLALIMRRAQT